MNTIELDTLGHVAYLDPLTGVGLLALPHTEADVNLGPESLNGSAWNEALRQLAALGWDLLTDEDWQEPITEGTTAAGCKVVALYGLDPTVTLPSFEEVTVSTNALRVAAGLS